MKAAVLKSFGSPLVVEDVDAGIVSNGLFFEQSGLTT